MRRGLTAAARPSARVPSLVVALLLAALVLAGCSTASAPTAGSTGAGGGVAATSAATPEPTPSPRPSPVVVEVQPPNGAVDVRLDTVLVVTAASGRLTDVTVTGSGPGGEPSNLQGTLLKGRAAWVAPPVLQPGFTYTVSSTAVGEDGEVARGSSTFATLTPGTSLTTEVSPLEGEVVGVGMPIQVELTSAVAPERRAAVQRRLTVTTSVPVEGAWSWQSDTEVAWRPMTWWPAGTTVSVGIDLTGLETAPGVWGAERRTIAFTVGRSVISTVDVAGHHMDVTIDGALARTIPVSTGKSGFLTRGGTKLVMSKSLSVRMNASSIGISRGDPEYYDLSDVRYAMRLTSSGEYIHAAPWSVGSQGRANVSHGCTGMSTANAQWLYEQSQRGDPVQYVNADRAPASPGNGWTHWDVPWDQWLAGSAA